MSDDKLEFEGEVIDSNKGQFKVKVNENVIVLCSLSGKIRMNSIKILTGDKVRIEVSPYDTTKGRIVHRFK
jgi:translation initiation factor IF-1